MLLEFVSWWEIEGTDLEPEPSLVICTVLFVVVALRVCSPPVEENSNTACEVIAGTDIISRTISDLRACA